MLDRPFRVLVAAVAACAITATAATAQNSDAPINLDDIEGSEPLVLFDEIAAEIGGPIELIGGTRDAFPAGRWLGTMRYRVGFNAGQASGNGSLSGPFDLVVSADGADGEFRLGGDVSVSIGNLGSGDGNGSVNGTLTGPASGPAVSSAGGSLNVTITALGRTQQQAITIPSSDAGDFSVSYADCGFVTGYWNAADLFKQSTESIGGSASGWSSFVAYADGSQRAADLDAADEQLAAGQDPKAAGLTDLEVEFSRFAASFNRVRRAFLDAIREVEATSAAEASANTIALLTPVITDIYTIVDDAESLQNRLREATVCERGVIGDSLQRFDHLIGQAVVSLLYFLLSPPIAENARNLYDVVSLAVRTGGIGPGSKLPTELLRGVEQQARDRVESSFAKKIAGCTDQCPPTDADTQYLVRTASLLGMSLVVPIDGQDVTVPASDLLNPPGATS